MHFGVATISVVIVVIYH